MSNKPKLSKSHYSPPDKNLWVGRTDSQKAERFHQAVKCYDLREIPHVSEKKAVAFLGFQSDEGIIRNLGRGGAKEGPDAIRKSLSNQPYHPSMPLIYDVGNISCNDRDLEEAQKQLGYAVAEILKSKALPILLGGGHEISWGHYQGIINSYPNADIACVNFDAHFDLRPVSNDNKGNSGTSFTQIYLDRIKRKLPFNYYCFGIQQSGNTKTLFETASKLNVKTILADKINNDDLTNHHAIVQEITGKPYIYLSICMDVFAAAYAPGVSAPQPLGLTPWKVIPLLRSLVKSGNLIGLDIAEVSPSLDRDGLTAKLAASILWEVILSF